MATATQAGAPTGGDPTALTTTLTSPTTAHGLSVYRLTADKKLSLTRDSIAG